MPKARAQSFLGVVRPLGEARPAWKVLRVLGNLLGLPGFDHDTSEDVRDEALATTDAATRLSNAAGRGARAANRRCAASSGCPTCRSIAPTRWCVARRRCRPRATRRRRWSACRARCGSNSGCRPVRQVRVSQNGAAAVLPAREDPSLARHRGARGGRAPEHRVAGPDVRRDQRRCRLRGHRCWRNSTTTASRCSARPAGPPR